MRGALIAAGVPAARIYRDYAGFRTLDSIVRAKEMFGQDRVIVVSQPFHLARALFLARWPRARRRRLRGRRRAAAVRRPHLSARDRRARRGGARPHARRRAALSRRAGASSASTRRHEAAARGARACALRPARPRRRPARSCRPPKRRAQTRRRCWRRRISSTAPSIAAFEQRQRLDGRARRLRERRRTCASAAPSGATISWCCAARRSPAVSPRTFAARPQPPAQRATTCNPLVAAKYAAYDRDGAYGVPFGWSAFGLLYDADKTREPPVSWAQVFGVDQGGAAARRLRHRLAGRARGELSRGLEAARRRSRPRQGRPTSRPPRARAGAGARRPSSPSPCPTRSARSPRARPASAPARRAKPRRRRARGGDNAPADPLRLSARGRAAGALRLRHPRPRAARPTPPIGCSTRCSTPTTRAATPPRPASTAPRSATDLDELKRLTPGAAVRRRVTLRRCRANGSG